MPTYRDLAAYVRGPAHAPPLPAIWDFFPCHAAAVGGVPSFLRYYLDPEEKVAVQRRLAALVPEALILPGVFPDLGVVVEASAFGGQLVWFEDGAPFIGPALHDPSEIDRLTLPPPGRAGLMPLLLSQRESMRRALRGAGREMERFGFSMGPAEIAGLVMGYDRFYLAMCDEPDRIVRLMALAAELVIGWLREQARACGGLEVLAVAEHVFHQVSPAHARRFILPCLQTIFAQFPETVRIYHNEGRHAEAHIEMVPALGADIWHFGSDAHLVPDLLDRVGERVVLFGGLNPHGVIRHGTPAEVRAEARAVVAAAAGRRLILSTGTGTTPDTPLENQRAMVEAALGA
ncbi:MAG: uroporphyrinogen decarboxylase family protein [Candidatus Methylomirabilota bacterium]